MRIAAETRASKLGPWCCFESRHLIDSSPSIVVSALPHDHQLIEYFIHQLSAAITSSPYQGRRSSIYLVTSFGASSKLNLYQTLHLNAMASIAFHLLGEDASVTTEIEVSRTSHFEDVQQLIASQFSIVDPKGEFRPPTILGSVVTSLTFLPSPFRRRFHTRRSLPDLGLGNRLRHVPRGHHHRRQGCPHRPRAKGPALHRQLLRGLPRPPGQPPAPV